MGIILPHVHVPMRSLYAVPANWSVLGSGVLLGMWMLANFDSAINYIEEARIPVRTVQRALLIVLEAMKMEHRIEAPSAGTVREVRVKPGDVVAGGALLVTLGT